MVVYKKLTIEMLKLESWVFLLLTIKVTPFPRIFVLCDCFNQFTKFITSRELITQTCTLLGTKNEISYRMQPARHLSVHYDVIGAYYQFNEYYSFT